MPLNSSNRDGNRIDRRRFLAAAAAGGVAAWAGASLPAAVAQPDSETLAATLFKSLSASQRESVAFPFGHPLRSKVDNNWRITRPRLGEFFSRDQQAMVKEIFLKLHSPEYAEKVLGQVEHDAGRRGFGGSSVAFFGEPDSGSFEFVLTGRHCTRRCDGDSLEGAAFGGPIFYGHAAESSNEGPHHPGNIYWYQALRANQVFSMLDGRQRRMALLGQAPPERGTETVRIGKGSDELAGIPVSEMSRDQQEEARRVLRDVLAPFRARDAQESLKLIDQAGFQRLHMSFYKNHDIGGDGVWDVWQIEGPAMVLYFRGQPHVHVWMHIRGPQRATSGA